jgi:hypothetical protein
MSEFKIHISKNHKLYRYTVKLYFYNYYIRQEKIMNRIKENNKKKIK